MSPRQSGATATRDTTEVLPDGVTPVDARPDVDGIEVDLVDGAATIARIDEIEAMYRTVYADKAHLADHSDPPFRQRLLRAAARDGFSAVLARVGSTAVGLGYGYTLPPDTGWWDGLVPSPAVAGEPGFTREWPGRTFAICEGLVLPGHRELHAGTAMYAAILVGRTEERATGLVAHTNRLMLELARTHGWTEAGELPPHPGWQPHVAFVLPLR